VLVYDPFVPEDRAHAARLSGPNVQLLRVPFCTHEAIRVLIKSGALQGLIEELVAGDTVGAQFWTDFRARKSVPKWQKSLLGQAVARGHRRLAVQAADAILRAGAGLPDEEMVFARRARREALKQAKAG
jgi:hypothetical protein